MLCASTCYSASANLSAIRDVLTKCCNIFVIDIAHLVLAEAARLLLELLIEGSSFRALVLRFLEVPVITCSHCGAPFRALTAIGSRSPMRNGLSVI